MGKDLDQYRDVVGDDTIAEIFEKSSALSDKHILNINSTYRGGGVAEVLNNLVPLMNDVGMDIGWRILHGSPDFFTVVKKFHNALQSQEINFTEMKQKVHREANEDFASYTHIDHDLVVVHDPQPLPLIESYKKSQPWIWRCHVDLSEPYSPVWDYMKTYILHYNQIILSKEEFKRESLPNPQSVVVPSIDPLSPKNKELKDSTIDKYLKKFDIPRDKPLITQVSRFDRWKDPQGVIKVFDRVKEKEDCRLVLLGSMAADDPEGQQVYESLVSKVGEREDIILVSEKNNILTNAVQRASDVVLQKSVKEGFGLTVAEALWKKTPVVGSNVGGIPLQIKEGVNGYLVYPDDYQETAEKVIRLLRDDELREKMGNKGKEIVKNNFLITRHMLDWIQVFKETLDEEN